MSLTNLTSPISFYPSVCFRQNKVREEPPERGFQHLAEATALFPSELSPPRWPCSPHRTTRASAWLTSSFSGTWGRICNERSSLGPSFCKTSWAAASGLDQVFYLCWGDVHTPPSRRLCLPPSHRSWAQRGMRTHSQNCVDLHKARITRKEKTPPSKNKLT